MMMTYIKQSAAFLLILAVLLLTAPPAVNAKTVPSDPYIDQWSYDDVGAFEAWDTFRGSDDVIVAVIDNGFDTYHPDLRANVWTNEAEVRGNGIDDDQNGYIDDMNGWDFTNSGDNSPRPDVRGLTAAQISSPVLHHGTAVAGIIGAVGNNRVGGAGLNWHVKLMNLRIIEEEEGSITLLPQAIRYAVDNGADVINFSIVGSQGTVELRDAINYAYENGVAMAAAAGNGNWSLTHSPMYPVCSDLLDAKQKVIGVSAMGEDHRIARFSNNGSCIDITAPGVNVGSSARYAPQFGLPNKYIKGLNGTSFATPFISGTMALLRGIRPDWTVDQVYEALLTSTHVTPANPDRLYRDLYGMGRLQVHKAVALAMQGRPLVGNVPTSVRALYDGQYATFLEDGTVSISKRDAAVYDDIAIVDGIEQVSFVASSFDGGEAHMYLLSDDLAVVSSFSFDASSAISVDSYTVDDPVIVVAESEHPSYSYREYDRAGKLIREVPLEGSPSKLFLSATVDTSAHIAIAKIEKHIITITEFNKDGTVVRTKIIPTFTDLSDFAIGNIDDDPEFEYVLLGGPQTGMWVMIRASDGSLQRTFSVYDPGLKLHLTMTLADINGDGQHEFIVADRGGNHPVRAWTARAKKLIEWSVKSASPRVLFSA